MPSIHVPSRVTSAQWSATPDSTALFPLFERALAIRERVLGPEHPDTVATRRALAELAAEGDGPTEVWRRGGASDRATRSARRANQPPSKAAPPSRNPAASTSIAPA